MLFFRQFFVLFALLAPVNQIFSADADQGTIVLLLGTSTAGKTTLIEAIKDQYPNTVDCSMDRLYFCERANDARQQCSVLYQQLTPYISQENIGKIVEGEIWFHFERGNSASNAVIWETLPEAAKNLHQQMKNWENSLFPHVRKNNGRERYGRMVASIIKTCKERKNVLVDEVNPNVLEKLKQSINSTHIKPILIFCGLQELAKRMKKRNDIAQNNQVVTDIRDGFPLWQYCSLYTRKKEGDNGPILESLTRQTVEEVFNHYLSTPLTPELEGYVKSILKIDDLTIKTFLSVLGFEGGVDCVDITMRNQDILGDFIVIDNTKNQSDPEILLDHVNRIAAFSGLLNAHIMLEKNL